MSLPVLLVVEHDAAVAHDVVEALRDRYGRDYRIESTHVPTEARAMLERTAADGEAVALVLAGQWLDGATGSELLDDAGRLHPHAKRSLLIDWGEWGDPAMGEAIFDAIARNRVDTYLVRPSPPPDELFHQVITSMLLEWVESQRTSPYTVHIVGQAWEGRAYELRELLGRCALPHTFSLADSTTGREVLEQAGHEGGFPVVLFPNGKVLRDPTNVEIVQAVGSPVDPNHDEFDLVIVGAGPAGLSAAVYGASEGLDVLVVDYAGLGGQATTSSLIRNYLGFSRGVSGRRLSQQAYEQAWIFGSHFAFMQAVTRLAADGDALVLDLADTGSLRAHAVLLATGADYQRIGIPELEALNGAGVFYGSTMSEAPGMIDRDVYVVGGANSAGQAALHLARYARKVTLLVRGESLHASMSQYLVGQVESTPRIEVRLATEVVGGGGAGRLEHLVLRHRATGAEEIAAAEGLFLMIGARPHTEWLPPEVARDEQGFVLTGSDLRMATAWSMEREPFALETSMSGVFAAGDVRHGAVRRVASAVGEGGIAVQQLHQHFAAVGHTPRGRVDLAAR